MADSYFAPADMDGDGLPDVLSENLPPDLKKIFEAYYSRKIDELPEAARIVARKIIEEDLVSEGADGKARRTSMDETKLLERPGASLELLNQLVDSFLLRREENSVRSRNYELSHDTLLLPVLKQRDERRAADERAEIEKKAREDEAKAAEERRFSEANRLKNEAIEAKRKAEKNLRYAIGLAILAVLAMVFAWSQFERAGEETKKAITEKSTAIIEKATAVSLRKKADTLRIEADHNFGLAKKNEAKAEAEKAIALAEKANAEAEKNRTEDVLKQLEKEKAETERQKKRAEENLTEAQNEGDVADKALADLFQLTIGEATKFIEQLDYEKAWDKLNLERIPFSVQKEVGEKMLELAFFFAETSRFDKARTALARAARLMGNGTMEPEGFEKKEDFQDAIGTLSPIYWAILKDRYFPKMIEIQGGEDTIFSKYPPTVKDPFWPVMVDDFSIAETETTWWQFNLFCVAERKSALDKPAAGTWAGDRPAINMTWDEAAHYARWLDDNHADRPEKQSDGYPKSPKSAQKFRLPKEEEWQFAANEKSYSLFAGGNKLEELAWFSENSGGGANPVKGRKANSLGLYDMSGNVSEWCIRWDESKSGTGRTSRGGSWSSSETECETRKRNKNRSLASLTKGDYLGFRVVLSR